ncbi:MAG: cytidine deaminase [Planctomycetota bacterium]|jgi:cytidine deaminase|nr:cytidine deaminase [Planctomycetota bacterium]
MTDQELIEQAFEARQKAYAPYSKFQVGAACIDRAGNLFTGANMENASYGLTVCAERVALWKAHSEACEPILKIAVVAEVSEGPVRPCGACRQVLAELAPDATVIMANTAGEQESKTVDQLLPLAFHW